MIDNNPFWELLDMISDGLFWLLINIAIPIGVFILIGLLGYSITVWLYDLIKDIHDERIDKE